MSAITLKQWDRLLFLSIIFTLWSSYQAYDTLSHQEEVKAKATSGSMMPTIQRNDRLILQSGVKPKRQDAVSLDASLCVPSVMDKRRSNPSYRYYYAKRIIGIPGDKVESKDGKIYINDMPLFEPYLPQIKQVQKQNWTLHDLVKSPKFNKLAYPTQDGRIPEGYYFVMGDNRQGSSDSRVWGYVPEEAIDGVFVDLSD